MLQANFIFYICPYSLRLAILINPFTPTAYLPTHTPLEDPPTPQMTPSPPDHMVLRGCIKSPNIHNMTPKTGPSLQYVLFSFAKHNSLEELLSLNNQRMPWRMQKKFTPHSIKISNELIWMKLIFLKNILLCYFENVVTHFHYPVFMSKMLFTRFSPPPPNLIWMGVITPQSNAGGQSKTMIGRVHWSYLVLKGLTSTILEELSYLIRGFAAFTPSSVI